MIERLVRNIRTLLCVGNKIGCWPNNTSFVDLGWPNSNSRLCWSNVLREQDSSNVVLPNMNEPSEPQEGYFPVIVTYDVEYKVMCQGTKITKDDEEQSKVLHVRRNVDVNMECKEKEIILIHSPMYISDMVQSLTPKPNLMYCQRKVPLCFVEFVDYEKEMLLPSCMILLNFTDWISKFQHSILSAI